MLVKGFSCHKCHKTIQDHIYRNVLLCVIKMLRDICEMCCICVRGEGDTCKIAKRYVADIARLRKDMLQILQDCEKICGVSWNITDPRKKRI